MCCGVRPGRCERRLFTRRAWAVNRTTWWCTRGQEASCGASEHVDGPCIIIHPSVHSSGVGKLRRAIEEAASRTVQAPRDWARLAPDWSRVAGMWRMDQAWRCEEE